MKISIIGCGFIGSALARHFSDKGTSLTLYDQNKEKKEALADEIKAHAAKSAKEAAAFGQGIFLCVKPKDLHASAKEMGPLENQIVFSVLAGVTLQRLKEVFPGNPLVRLMPNLAISAHEGVIAIALDEGTKEAFEPTIKMLLEGLGTLFWTEEEKMDAITALTGSGPAFVLAMIESMIESGILMGLNAKEAETLTLQAISGVIKLLQKEKKHPAELRWQMASPGGTTIAGLKEFEDRKVRSGIIQTVLASYLRAKEL